MVTRKIEYRLPPKRPKIRGLRIAEKSPHKSKLEEIALYVKNDDDLDLQIRDGYLNIYYCGGSLLKISGFRGKSLSFKFDDKYFKRPDQEKEIPLWLPSQKDDFHEWKKHIYKLKKTMKEWLTSNRKVERGLQQRICSESNRNSDTSLIILDIEYAVWLNDTKKGRRLCRFDMVAIPRESLFRSGPLPIYLVEFKQGNKALFGKSGVEEHAKDLLQFMSIEADTNAREAFKCSVKNILCEKIELELIPGVKIVPYDRELEIKAAFLFHETKKEHMLKLQERVSGILLNHGAKPLFWETSQDLSSFFGYDPS